MALRDDAWYIITVAGGAASAGITWFLNSPLFGVVTGVLLGTGLAMLTQSRIQKRIWKRELALKNIDTIYGPLYKELDHMSTKIAGFNANSGYQTLEDSQWRERISSEYVFHFIPEELRSRLVELYSMVHEFNRAIGEANSAAERQCNLSATEVFGTEAKPVVGIWYCLSAYPGMVAPCAVFIPAIFGTHPNEVLRSTYPDTKYAARFVRVQLKSETGDSPTRDYMHPDDLAKFDKVFDELSRKVQSLPQVKRIRGLVPEISQAATKSRDSILRLIKAPWKV